MKYNTLLHATYSVTESLFHQRRAYNSLLVNFDLKITASPGHYFLDIIRLDIIRHNDVPVNSRGDFA